MTKITAYLSPNGQSGSQAPKPANCLKVATVEGVATLERAGKGAPWALSSRSLQGQHIGSLLFEPLSGKLFADAITPVSKDDHHLPFLAVGQ